MSKTKNNTEGHTTRKRRKVLSLETKLNVIKSFENGKKIKDIGEELNLHYNTIRNILNDTEKYRSLSQLTTSVTQCLRNRNPIMIEMEDLLSVWLEDCNRKKIPITTANVTNKAIEIFDRLKMAKYNNTNETFAASKGWFHKFKTRYGLKSIKLSGEAASADTHAASKYPEELKNIIEENNYDYRQIFNVDETGLYWKKMPSRTFITEKENLQPGYKTSKERITLLLGGNASGDFKLKPLLVNKSFNPRALKNTDKNALPVMWKANNKAWVTKSMFEEWFIEYFCPAVQNYCQDNNLDNKALLVLDNAPGHPKSLDSLSENIKVVFLPPNTTSLLQPMDQGVIATFKAYYLRSVFAKAVEATTGNVEVTLEEFWKKFNIGNALEHIDKAWKEVTPNCMKGVWKKLLPDFPNVQSQVEDLINECVTIGHDLGMDDVTTQDVHDILMEETSLTVEDIFEITINSSANNFECETFIEQNEIEIEYIDVTEHDAEAELKQEMTQIEFNKLLECVENFKSQIVEIDPNRERRDDVCKEIDSVFSRYKKLKK